MIGLLKRAPWQLWVALAVMPVLAVAVNQWKRAIRAEAEIAIYQPEVDRLANVADSVSALLEESDSAFQAKLDELSDLRRDAELAQAVADSLAEAAPALATSTDSLLAVLAREVRPGLRDAVASLGSSIVAERANAAATIRSQAVALAALEPLAAKAVEYREGWRAERTARLALQDQYDRLRLASKGTWASGVTGTAIKVGTGALLVLAAQQAF